MATIPGKPAILCDTVVAEIQDFDAVCQHVVGYRAGPGGKWQLALAGVTNGANASLAPELTFARLRPPLDKGDFRGLRSRASRPPYPVFLNDGNGFVLVLLIVVDEGDSRQ